MTANVIEALAALCDDFRALHPDVLSSVSREQSKSLSPDDGWNVEGQSSRVSEYFFLNKPVSIL